MRNVLCRLLLIAAAALSLATAASAGDWTPKTVPPADGYYLTNEAVYAKGEKVRQTAYKYAFDDGVLTGDKEINAPGTADEQIVTTQYFYDADGNCTKAELAGHTAAGGDYTIGTMQFTYDGAGNLAASVYDGVTTTYTYDGAGLLTKEVSQYDGHEAVTEYIYGVNGVLAGEMVTLDGGAAWQYDYANDKSGKRTECDEYYYEAGRWVLNTRQVYTYDSHGNNIQIAAYDADNVLFETHEYNYKKLGSQLVRSPFQDVQDEGDWYYTPVLWAVENEITTGITATEFAPGSDCTRAQAVTFLWRAAGQPKPKTAANPFIDVEKGNYYYDAVLWAYENGITNGLDKTRFGPDATCTRAQIVTFLWRYEGKRAASGSTFSDVPENAYYYDAVLWATANGITNGVGGGRFAPESTCSRGHIVTFLSRNYAAVK